MSKTKHAPDWTDFRNIHVPEINIDLTDPNSYSNKVVPEQETRRRILTHARLVGCEKEMMLLFIKADKTMRTCRNEAERKDISKLFNVEVYKLLGGGGELYIDGELVCKDK